MAQDDFGGLIGLNVIADTKDNVTAGETAHSYLKYGEQTVKLR